MSAGRLRAAARWRGSAGRGSAAGVLRRRSAGEGTTSGRRDDSGRQDDLDAVFELLVEDLVAVRGARERQAMGDDVVRPQVAVLDVLEDLVDVVVRRSLAGPE